MRRSLGLSVAALLLPGLSWAQGCALTVEANDMVQYVQHELTVSSACSEITVTLKHTGTLSAAIMGHNWVLTKTRDYHSVAEAGQVLAPPYVPKGDARVLAATDLIGGGEETTVTFDGSILEAGGDYTYFCTYPGHSLLMYGKLIVKQNA